MSTFPDDVVTTDDSSTSTTTDSTTGNTEIVIACVVTLIVILLFIASCGYYSNKNQRALKRLYFRDKEANPTLTYTAWKEQRTHADELVAADLEFQQHQAREQNRRNKAKGKATATTDRNRDKKPRSLFSGFFAQRTKMASPEIRISQFESRESSPMPRSRSRPEDEESLVGGAAGMGTGPVVEAVSVTPPYSPPLPRRTMTWGSIVDAPPAYESIPMEDHVLDETVAREPRQFNGL